MERGQHLPDQPGAVTRFRTEKEPSQRNAAAFQEFY